MTPERAIRVADFIRAELAEIVRSEMRDPRVSLLSITDARVSRDLSVADVYVSSMAWGARAGAAPLKQEPPAEGVPSDRQPDEVVAVLNGAAGFLRTALASRHSMRTTPRLRFHYDELLESAPRLETLIDRAVEADDKRAAGADAPQNADHGP